MPHLTIIDDKRNFSRQRVTILKQQHEIWGLKGWYLVLTTFPES